MKSALQSMLFITYYLANINEGITCGHFALTIRTIKPDYNVENVFYFKEIQDYLFTAQRYSALHVTSSSTSILPNKGSNSY